MADMHPEVSDAQVEDEERMLAELTARKHNQSDLWDRLWSEEGDETWRAQALERVYKRVCHLLATMNPLGPHGVSVTDLGGGRGILAKQIIDSCPMVGQLNGNMIVVDSSPTALHSVGEKGIPLTLHDLEGSMQEHDDAIGDRNVFVSTECFEHLSEAARNRLYRTMQEKGSSAILSVPNNRLGPDEEPQHTVKFTAMSLKRELEVHWPGRVRIEVLGPYLLAVCGTLAEKSFTMSATLPVRDEGKDLEGTLASIRGIADQLIVGIDPRTEDNTWEIAELYADEVFFLKDPMGPPTDHTRFQCEACHPNGIDPGEESSPCKEYMGENGINFSWARNQCLDRCTGDWIFMTEGHERLVEGGDLLLSIDQVMPKGARVGFVLRQGQGQQWSFPWLFQNAKDIRFTRPVHNILDFPEGTFCVSLPNVKTLHDRHHDRSATRAKQREAQNRTTLLDDWLSRKSEASLFYLGQEWRDIDPAKAVDRLEQFLTVSNNGVQRYQARLILAKQYMIQKDFKSAFRVLHGCSADDWTRTEHFAWLGDVAFMENDFEKAYTFYKIATTKIGCPPITVWWIDLMYYSYLPAQRMAMVCGELGRHEEALVYCEQVLELLPIDAPSEATEEAQRNVTIVRAAIVKP